MMIRRRLALVASVIAALTPTAWGWDAFGHRLVARLALEGAAKRLGAQAPDWMKDPTTAIMIADTATTPDRWRSTRVPSLTHLNNPDHYVDIEQLADFGMTLRTMPPLRHECAGLMAVARSKPGFKGEPVNEARDPDRVLEYPGFLPQAAMETWGKVVSSMKTLRTLEQLGGTDRKPQIDMARAAVMYNMGILAHYCGDAAQPLHTTVHHHGWVGDNPKGYTTDRKIHSWIDGGVVKLHGITLADVRSACTFTVPMPTDAPAAWEQFLSEVERSFAQVEPLYILKKSGDLDRAAGKKFIEQRLADGADTLSALYAGAWEASKLTDKDIQDFSAYDGATP